MDKVTIKPDVNEVGLSQGDYRGLPSTLCPGCGHNTISSQIMAACYDLNLNPEKLAKFSGIGCSSKSPTYFLKRSFGFNGLHGRMPSLALGALFADVSVKGIGISGDGDTASIGFGQFKHIVRRNMPMVYIIENNGVYGLTKGQFSATADLGLELKHQGVNKLFPVDLAMEAIVSGASFVARSFAGDAKQIRELIKAALSHNGIAVIDIISPCVTFNNHDDTLHSYVWGRANEIPLHDISYIPNKKEILVDNFKEGTTREVVLHDGSKILLRKLEKEYDPSNKWHAMRILQEAEEQHLLITGLIYIDPNKPTLFELLDLVDEPLNRLESDRIRPSSVSLDEINASMY
ncbi:MAG: 2-oxoacid:ferredoxin oxidoreductase subunit beta [Anaerolineaceae bacterium]|nr:2-oxoacid:ferredoxin oxidoreductase subunit beta [Anaerolineaceae bacterium]